MPCTERSAPRRLHLLAAAAAAALLAGCAGSGPRAPAAAAAPVATTSPATAGAPRPAAPGPAAAASPVALAAPVAARSWDEFKLQAARRMMAANPHMTYTGPVPDPLLAIPVLEIELERDGSVRRIDVMRWPSQARDTTQMAIEAVRRAAPYGDMSRLPRPWKFAEVFLFDDDRRFKPRTLDTD